MGERWSNFNFFLKFFQFFYSQKSTLIFEDFRLKYQDSTMIEILAEKI